MACEDLALCLLLRLGFGEIVDVHRRALPELPVRYALPEARFRCSRLELMTGVEGVRVEPIDVGSLAIAVRRDARRERHANEDDEKAESRVDQQCSHVGCEVEMKRMGEMSWLDSSYLGVL